MQERKRAPGHPGGILKRRYLDTLEVSTTAFAEAIGVSRKTVSKIVNERGTITADMALRIAKALDTTPEMWLNLQRNYDLWQAAHNSEEWKSVTKIAA